MLFAADRTDFLPLPPPRENWPHINPEDKVHQGRPLNPYQFSEFFDQSSSSVTKELLVSILGSSHTYDRPIWRGAGGGGGGGKGAGRPQGAGDMQQQEMGERVKQAVEKFFIHFKMAFLTLFHMLKGTEKVVNDIEKFIAIEEKYHHYTKQWIVNFISMVNSGR